MYAGLGEQAEDGRAGGWRLEGCLHVNHGQYSPQGFRAFTHQTSRRCLTTPGPGSLAKDPYASLHIVFAERHFLCHVSSYSVSSFRFV